MFAQPVAPLNKVFPFMPSQCQGIAAAQWHLPLNSFTTSSFGDLFPVSSSSSRANERWPILELPREHSHKSILDGQLYLA